MNCESYYLIIGKTLDGENFRPSDWAERISGLGSKFSFQKKLYYSHYVRPTQIEGINSLIINKNLKKENNLLWEYVFLFAEENKLTIKQR